METHDMLKESDPVAERLKLININIYKKKVACWTDGHHCLKVNCKHERFSAECQNDIT